MAAVDVQGQKISIPKSRAVHFGRNLQFSARMKEKTKNVHERGRHKIGRRGRGRVEHVDGLVTILYDRHWSGGYVPVRSAHAWPTAYRGLHMWCKLNANAEIIGPHQSLHPLCCDAPDLTILCW